MLFLPWYPLALVLLPVMYRSVVMMFGDVKPTQGSSSWNYVAENVIALLKSFEVIHNLLVEKGVVIHRLDSLNMLNSSNIE